tara:strand:+ start:398 stop:574 length:177 start_codon:yes stop_codon:yes gene_type:complete
MPKYYINKELIYHSVLLDIQHDIENDCVKEDIDYYLKCWKDAIEHALERNEYEIEVKE